MATMRTLKLGSLIQTELAELLARKVKDPRLTCISITGVDVAPDLSQAKIFYSIFGQGQQKDIEKAFKSAAPFLRKEMAAKLRLKTTPKLIPVFDHTLLQAVKLEGLIKQAREQDQQFATRNNGEEGANAG